MRIEAYVENGGINYEESELSIVNISNPIFYSICYLDRLIMERFIQETVFTENSYMDNDMGKIELVDRLKEDNILEFIE